MSESTEGPSRPPIAASPISVILFGPDPHAEVPQAWPKFLAFLKRPTEILLVRPSNSEAHRFGFEPAQGYASALQSAIRAAQHPLLVVCPLDPRYRPEDLQGMLATIDQADFVAGFRVLPIPTWRVILDLVLGILARIFLGLPWEKRQSWLGPRGCSHRLLARLLFGLRVIDPECPYRLYRREIFTRIPLQSHGDFVHVEILAKANHLMCLYDEVPLSCQAEIKTASFFTEAWRLFRKPQF